MGTDEKTIAQEAATGNPQPEIRQAPDFITVYSTTARVAYSEYDIRIFLGDVVFPNPSEKRDKEVIEERLCIILPLKCAASLANEMEAVTDGVEEVFGS